jgi:Sec-independent protein translocase protein TatA
LNCPEADCVINLPLFHFAEEVYLMFGLQPGHIVIIILIALIFFAPSRLPLLTRGIGKMLSEFRKEISAKPKTAATTAKKSDSEN